MGRFTSQTLLEVGSTIGVIINFMYCRPSLYMQTYAYAYLISVLEELTDSEDDVGSLRQGQSKNYNLEEPAPFFGGKTTTGI